MLLKKMQSIIGNLTYEIKHCRRNETLKTKEEHHEYSDTHNILYVVHNHKWRHLHSVDSVLRVRPGFRVSHTKQMVPHSARNFQRGYLLVPRVVQNRLSGLQCCSLRGSADHRMKRNIQQSLALDGYSADTLQRQVIYNVRHYPTPNYILPSISLRILLFTIPVLLFIATIAWPESGGGRRSISCN